MIDIQKLKKQFSTWSADELRPAVLATSVLSSLLIYILEVIFVISFAALVFSSKLTNQLPQALGFIIIGDALMVGTIALLSSYAGSVGVSQDTPGAVLGVVAVAVISALSAANADQQFATIVMMIVLTTLMTGVLFILLGIFKLGGLARFLPYPVMGGFLAGTGWLLAKGGVGVMTIAPFGIEWFSSQALLHWLPGAILGVVVFIVASRINKPITLPVTLVLGGILFYIFVSAMRVPVSELQTDGWLVGMIPVDSLTRFPLSAGVLSQVDWTVLLKQIPNLLPAAIISVIALLLNSGGLELVTRKDIDLNRELVAAGVGNLLAGIVGGLVGYPAISLSTLNHKMNGGKRLVGIFTALFLLITIFFSASFLAFIPKMILGAVLVYLGVGLLYEWVYEAWFKFPHIDFAIILTILAVIIVSGFLNGVIVGLVMAIILFVVSYSQVNIVKFALTGQEYRSRVTRNMEQQQFLQGHGNQIFILKLQGFIFFGTANKIFDQVRHYIQNEAEPIRFVLLDFAEVSGLDSTGLLSFRRMFQWGQEYKITVFLTGLSGRTRDQFVRSGFRDQVYRLRFDDDIDHGIEQCENELLAEASFEDQRPTNLVEELQKIFGNSAAIEKLVSHMQRREIGLGEYLIRQDEKPDMIYFIETGQVTAQLESPDHPPVRLETMRGVHLVGEVGFYLGIKRTAAVIADQSSVVYCLSTIDLANLENSEPEAASIFHRIVAHFLGERVVHLTQVTNALERS